MGIHRVKLYLTLITALLITCITASCAGRQDSGTVTDDKKIRVAVIDTGFSEKRYHQAILPEERIMLMGTWERMTPMDMALR